MERFARLDLSSFEYVYNNITATANSASLSSDSKWTRVTAELHTLGDASYVLPKMVLYGPGTAWFDDLSLELVP